MTLVDGFDLCMLLIVVFFAVKGIFRGFSGEIFSLAGVIGGVYFGFKYADPVDAALRNFFGSLNASVSRMIAIALVFFAVCIVCALIGKLFRALLSMVSLSALDRLCGFLISGRSEEHTSELQSRINLVCRLLLEKKKLGNNRQD